jgi:4-hydroxybenzoate polyprenyltransferase
LVGLAVLLCFNRFSIWLGVASLGIIAVYPLMKRVTSWPQAALGLAFSWGALMGWSATFASLALAPILLYASAFAWTIGYARLRGSARCSLRLCPAFGRPLRLFGSHVKFGVRLSAQRLHPALALAAVKPPAAAQWRWSAGLLMQRISLGRRRRRGASPPTALKLFHAPTPATPGLILFARSRFKGGVWNGGRLSWARRSCPAARRAGR